MGYCGGVINIKIKNRNKTQSQGLQGFQKLFRLMLSSHPTREDIVDIVVPHSNPCNATNGRSGNYCNLPRGVNVYFLFVALSLSTLGVRFADKWYKFSVINKLAVLYSYSPPPRHHHQYK